MGALAFALGEMESPEGSEQWRTSSDLGIQCPSRWVREETRGKGRSWSWRSREEGEMDGSSWGSQRCLDSEYTFLCMWLVIYFILFISTISVILLPPFFPRVPSASHLGFFKVAAFLVLFCPMFSYCFFSPYSFGIYVPFLFFWSHPWNFTTHTFKIQVRSLNKSLIIIPNPTWIIEHFIPPVLLILKLSRISGFWFLRNFCLFVDSSSFIFMQIYPTSWIPFTASFVYWQLLLKSLCWVIF